MKKITILALGLFALILSGNSSAMTMTYDFVKITNNNMEDLSSQLSITLWDETAADTQFGEIIDSNQILFTVQNNVGIASNIAEVYIDDGLLGPSVVVNSLGGFTDFSGGGATPSDLPGGNTVGFSATASFSADVNPGPPANGVNASNDILGLILGLGSFADFDAVIAAVNDGSLRFGLHVRSIGIAGESDSYVSAVPVPAAVWLMGTGLVGLIGFGRRRQSI
jgi:hypothetical protein